MDFKFEFEQTVDGHAVGSIDGIAEIQGHELDWHVARIRLTGSRFEDGHTAWRDVTLTGRHYLHPVILSFLNVDCADAIGQALHDAGRRGYDDGLGYGHQQHEFI